MTSNAAPGPGPSPTSVSEQLTRLGPFFAAESHDRRAMPSPPWRPMSELLDDPAAVSARVETSRAFLATAGGLKADQIELRVAASITHLGLAARTLSPLLAAAVTCDHTRPTGLHDLWWQPTIGSMFPLSIAELDDVPTIPKTSPETIAHTLAETTIETIAAELYTIFTPFGLSERLLLGNVASALNGASTALSSASPPQAPRARAVVTALMQQPALTGTSQISLDGRFQRLSCCLIYRAAPERDGTLCGDCVLLGIRGRRRDAPPPLAKVKY